MWAFSKKTIDWYEFDSTRVRTPFKPLRPFNRGKFKYQTNSGKIIMNSLQFFSSMARTAVLKNPLWHEEFWEVLSFWIRYARHFENGQTTRLRSGSTNYYKDADRTYWASRLGETFGYIEMQRRGYKLIDHMPTALKRVGAQVSVTGGADYYCHGSKGISAIAEFKGHIVNPNNRSLTTIKAQLYEALEQCDKIARVLPKGIKANSFAVASYIRESGDSSNEPSLIAVSDPDVYGKEIDISSEEFLEAVLRGNYGTWIQMMGFETLGFDIVNNKRSTKVEGFELISLNYKGERYVFLEDNLWDDVLGINIAFGLQEDIFKQIVIASINGNPLSELETIIQLLEEREDIESKIKKDVNNLDSVIETDVYIFNDKAIAIKLSKIYDSDFKNFKWDISRYFNDDTEHSTITTQTIARERDNKFEN